MSKIPTEKNIDRPLGLGRRSAGGKARFSFGWKSAGLSLVAVSVLAISSLITLRDRPFRHPAPLVVSQPETLAETSAEPPTPLAGYPEAGSGGASIIRVDPPVENGTDDSVVIIRDPSTLTQHPRLAHLPDRDLVEESEYGPLPIRAADGRRPFDVYPRPWSGTRGARVAIVIGGLGVSQSGTQEAIAELPPEVTLAFASGGNSLDRWMQAARRGGHEILLQVPLEPFDYPNVNPGRDTLTVDASPEENRDRLYRSLSRITNYTGIMNYMGARFVANEDALAPLIGELGKRGLMYLDDGSAARSHAEQLTLANHVPFAAADMKIDGERERGEILQKLDDLERTARAQGFAIGTGSAFDVTVETVTAWIAEAKRRGIEIVPISAVAHDPERDLER